MESRFPLIMLACGVYMLGLLSIPKLRANFRSKHPLGDRLEKSETAALWMTIIGALWSLQNLFQG